MFVLLQEVVLDAVVERCPDEEHENAREIPGTKFREEILLLLRHPDE